MQARNLKDSHCGNKPTDPVVCLLISTLHLMNIPETFDPLKVFYDDEKC